MGMIELDSTAQNSVHKLTVNFAYRKAIFNNEIYNARKENNNKGIDVIVTNPNTGRQEVIDSNTGRRRPVVE